ncbi:MAG: TonB-dependent receptor [Prevotella sp.]|nr:TonB-dependent receptor [Prevotella sp.]
MKIHFITMVLLSIATPAAVNAANENEEPVDTSKVIELQDVQVVSTRATRRTPMAYTNMDREQVQQLNKGKDIPYLLSMTPSVTMSSDAGTGIGYTGLHIRGTDPTRINVTANGIPINDAESSNVFWSNMPDFASSAEDIQIQRGVGTSTNGAGAFGATVNMQTERIGMQPFVGIDLTGGSYYTHKETVRFGTGLIDGHWGLQGRLSNISSKGYLDRASADMGSYFLQAGYFGDNTVVKFVTFNGKEETYHAWNYASKYEQELYGRTFNSCGLYYDEHGNMKYYEDQKDFYHQQHYQLLWDQRVDSQWKISTGLHYTKGTGYYEQYKYDTKLSKFGLNAADFFNPDGGEIKRTDLINQKWMDNDFYGIVASANYDNREGLTMNIGGGWNRYDGDHFGRYLWIKNYMGNPAGKEYYRNDARKIDGNIYGKVHWEFAKGLSAFADLQYRHVSLRMDGPTDEWDGSEQLTYNIHSHYDFFNPKAGLFYDINPNIKAYASVAVAHKEPTRNDYEENMNADLKAERLTDYELGVKYSSERLTAGANIYYMDYKNQFVLTGEINDIGEMVSANSGRSYRFGIELEAAYKPVDWFRWDANATFSRNRTKNWEAAGVEEGSWSSIGTVSLGETPIAFSPETIFNNIFTFMHKGFRASLRSQFIGEQYMSNTGFKSFHVYEYDDNYNITGEKTVGMTLKSNFVTHLDLSYTTKALSRLGIKEATAGMTIYNIFSEKYDNNGWAYCEIGLDKNGSPYAWSDSVYEAGFAPQAPCHLMFNVSLNF